MGSAVGTCKRQLSKRFMVRLPPDQPSAKRFDFTSKLVQEFHGKDKTFRFHGVAHSRSFCWPKLKSIGFHDIPEVECMACPTEALINVDPYPG